MKIFISWSGERSQRVADLLKWWIQCVLQAVDPWLSSKDIDRGSLWFSEITGQLSSTQNGIVCLTKSNIDKPWILFESGALAKGLSSSRVYTFLIDLDPTEVKDPLAQFNHTKPDKHGVYQLVRSINNSLNDKALKEDTLSNVFATYWPQFEENFRIILDSTKNEEIPVKINQTDILSEILSTVRGLDKRVRSLEITPPENIDNEIRVPKSFRRLGIDEKNELDNMLKKIREEQKANEFDIIYRKVREQQKNKEENNKENNGNT